MANSYTNHGALDEYWATRQKAGIIDLSPLRKYEVTGPDAELLLQTCVTRNIRKLAVGQVVELLVQFAVHFLGEHMQENHRVDWRVGAVRVTEAADETAIQFAQIAVGPVHVFQVQRQVDLCPELGDILIRDMPTVLP